MLYFVYEETYPDTGIPFYVGISNNPNQRHKQHMDARDNNLRKKAVIEKIAAKGLEPRINILESVEGDQKARMREKHWIQYYASQGIMLTNIQDYDVSTYVEFSGCLFRSFKEVQWAIFLETLDIPYQYRERGLVINGEWYIPSFWLPEQDCFVEIRERKPTIKDLDDENHVFQARELALQTGKDSYIICGDVSLSYDNTETYKEYSPTVWSYDRHTRCAIAMIEVSQDALVIMQRLYDMGLEFRVIGPTLEIVPCINGRFRVDYIEQYLETVQKQLKDLPALIPSIKRMEDELASVLWIQGEYPQFMGQGINSGDRSYRWSECTKCSHIFIKHPTAKACRACKDGMVDFESPRLIAAVTMTRQLCQTGYWKGQCPQ